MRTGLSLLVLLGSFMLMVRGQLSPSMTPSNVTDDTNQETQQSEEQMDEQDALMQLRNVDSLEGFLALMRDSNGNNISMDALFAETEEEGKVTIRGGGRMALPDNCSPRNMTVELEIPNSEHNAVFFPKCTRIERCGGCTSSPHLKCISSYDERVSLKVLKGIQAYPGSHNLQWVGFETILVDRHVSCVVRCELDANKCGPMKTFRQSSCDCACKNSYQRCQPPKHFSPESCQCECSNSNQRCCSRESGGQCRLVFDSNTCQCRLISNRTHIDSGVAHDVDAEIQNYVQLYNVTMSAPISCARHRCPRLFRAVLSTGRCRCRPTRRFARVRPRVVTRRNRRRRGRSGR